MNYRMRRQVFDLVMWLMLTALIAIMSVLLMTDAAHAAEVAEQVTPWWYGITFDQVLVFLAAIVGLASALAKLLTLIAGITPNTKDDDLAGGLSRFASRLQGILDRLALNPKADQARKR